LWRHGGLIESEEEMIYGVFVNRAGECTIFELLRDGQGVRWDRVEEPSSLAGEYPASNVVVSIATTQKLPSNLDQSEVGFGRTRTGAAGR
jgi:hypothetical protein